MTGYELIKNSTNKKIAFMTGVSEKEAAVIKMMTKAEMERCEHICPETMGKVNQLGSLDEVLALCSVDKRILPCIDFGHLNARDGGIIKGKDDYLRIIDRMAEKLKDDRFMYFHSHFSKIEYTTGGEKRHLTFRDNVWGPEFEPLMDVVYENNLSPVFICESAGTQTEDAQTMKLYHEAKKGK